MRKRYALFIGRWQPFHKGHEWLINAQRTKGKHVLVAVRDIEPDEHNPLTAQQSAAVIRQRYHGSSPEVRVIVIPDIESVNWGRGVGYEPIEHEPPPAIHNISATEIRRQIAEGDDGWKECVHPSIHGVLERLLCVTCC